MTSDVCPHLEVGFTTKDEDQFCQVWRPVGSLKEYQLSLQGRLGELMAAHIDQETMNEGA